MTLTGFKQGSKNTVQFLGDGNHAAPELDWIEVMAAPRSSGNCNPASWTVSARNSDGASPARQAVDGNPATRWSSGRAQASASDASTVGYGATVKISSLTINNSIDNSANDFPTTARRTARASAARPSRRARAAPARSR